MQILNPENFETFEIADLGVLGNLTLLLCRGGSKNIFYDTMFHGLK